MKSNNPILVCFWDYDTQWGADRSRAKGGIKTWGRLDFEYTEELLEIHDRYSIPACFAVVGAAACPGERPYHDPGQIRRIYEAGHEVASHSFRHEWLPGLNRAALLETLRTSKAAIEDCIGAPVSSFVPPFNQPFDYARRLSFSVSERREAPIERTDLFRLCESLRETGYTFCRVSYRPLQTRLAERILGRELNRPGRLENIAGITCLRANAPCGFDARALRLLTRCSSRGGITAVHGHPHSIRSGGPQDKEHLVALLDAARDLCREGRLSSATPSSLLSKEVEGLGQFTRAR